MLLRGKEPTPDLLQCSPTDSLGHKGHTNIKLIVNLFEHLRAQGNSRALGSEEACSFALRSRVLYSCTRKWPRKKWLQRKKPLEAGKHSHAAFRTEGLRCLEIDTEWWARGKIPWNAGQPTSQVRKILWLIRKQNHKKKREKPPKMWQKCVCHSDFYSLTSKPAKVWYNSQHVLKFLSLL